jgi:hypothetical protein
MRIIVISEPGYDDNFAAGAASTTGVSSAKRSLLLTNQSLTEVRKALGMPSLGKICRVEARSAFKKT